MSLTPTKAKEWYKWGKEGFRSTRANVLRNSHHPDYSTPEKIKEFYDRYGDSYMLSPEREERLKEKFGYTSEDVQQAFKLFKDAFNSSRNWYEKADRKYKAVLDKYRPIFDKAEVRAKMVDVSDIKDGFPCGSAHLVLQRYAEVEDLSKALAHFSDTDVEHYKYRLPIKFPTYGQCVAFDERICEVVKNFLREYGIFTRVYTWID